MGFRSFLIIIVTLVISNSIAAQEKWDLRKCVNYAVANNISIKQSAIQAQIAGVQYKQSKAAQYPNLNFSGNSSFNSGLHQDPTTFQLITQNYVAAGLELQTSAQIFNWFSRQNSIAAAKWQEAAAKAGTDKLKDDISLTVANAYLQILLTKQQARIADIQLQQSKAQLDNTRKMVDAGSLPELNATELEAQVETDSANYINANGNVQQSILQLKAYMNMDAADSFEIEEPPVELIPVEKIADLQPDFVYSLALVNLPQQRVNDFKLKASQKNADVAKASMYPVISGFGSVSTNYSNSPYNTFITGSYEVNTIGSVNINGTEYSVAPPQPITQYYTSKAAFGRQLNNNLGESIGIGITVPILNGRAYRSNWEIAKLNTQNLELQKLADNQTLKQDIYQAYNAAIVALEKFNASKKNVNASQRSYDFAQKRYEVGILSTIELITNQNNLLSAKLQYVQNQFDYVFKMKVLEFYKGQGLKL